MKRFQKAWVWLLALTGLLYAPLLKAQFVFDDLWTIVRNPAIRSISPWLFLLDPNTVAHSASGLASDIYRPLVTLSFALDYHLWKLWPLPYHFENILLFLLNGVLLAILLKRILKNEKAAVLGAVVFLWHPVQVQSVAWVTQRSSLLSGAGLLGALLCWTQPVVSVSGMLAGLVIYGLALLAKESAIVLPVIFLLTDRCWRVDSEGTHRQKRLLYGGLVIVTVSYLFLRASRLHQWTQYAGQARAWGADFALGMMSLPVYFGKLLVPIGLRPSYGYPLFNSVWIVGGVVLLVCYIACVWVLRRRLPIACLALAWVGVGLLPYLQILPVRAFVAERFLYVSMMGAALGVGWMYDRWKSFRWGVVLWLGMNLIITFYTVPNWRDEQQLWAYAVRQEPSNAFAQACYAETLGLSPEAEAHYRAALLNRPTETVRKAVVGNLIELYTKTGQPDKAAALLSTLHNRPKGH